MVDAYFSGTKIKHLLDSFDGLRARAARGEILFGTVDTFLIWRLTGGRQHVTDVSNASRTLLFNIHTLQWDDELLALLDVPRAMLPEVRSSSEVYGETLPELFGSSVPICRHCGRPAGGDVRAGVLRAGHGEEHLRHRLLHAAEHRRQAGAVGEQPADHDRLAAGRHHHLRLEGSVFVAGAVVQWLRDGLGVIQASADVEVLMAEVPDTDGVYLVPAFVGLGAPYWDPRARGMIVGLTRDTRMAHIARAAVEAMAYQTRDVLEVMQHESGLPLTTLKVDGGAAANATLLQFQADLLDVPVRRPVVGETTALGAAYLAGLAVGYWDGLDDVRRNWALDREFGPSMPAATRERLYAGWKKAVGRSLAWEDQ